jgi:hypothetical protein
LSGILQKGLINVEQAGTGVAPTLSAVGSDTDVDVQLAPQAAGTVKTSAPMRILIGTAIPSGGTVGSGYRFSSTANFGIFFGSGAPMLSAAQASFTCVQTVLQRTAARTSTQTGRLDGQP